MKHIFSALSFLSLEGWYSCRYSFPFHRSHYQLESIIAIRMIRCHDLYLQFLVWSHDAFAITDQSLEEEIAICREIDIILCNFLIFCFIHIVGVTGLEPATPASQMPCASLLRHTPIMPVFDWNGQTIQETFVVY